MRTALSSTACRSVLLLGAILSCSQSHAAEPSRIENAGKAQTNPRVEADGTVHVPAFDLPESSFLSEETRTALKQWREVSQPASQKALQACPLDQSASQAKMPALRKCQAEAFYTTPLYRHMRDRYAVAVTLQEMGGVHTEVFTPADGIAAKNARRVLVNVHGGGFQVGSRWASHVESIPIAAVGKIKVISIDYRMAPEYTFPAASEDVAAVYRELLKNYKPENIGLYGCSAGAALTAQAIAWFQRERLPLPAAVGMFCYGAPRALHAEHGEWGSGDAGVIVSALSGDRYFLPPSQYYRGVDRHASVASPGDYDEVMAKFPPSLLVSGGRDFALSSVLVTHAQLVRLGVEAQLHVWEGMSHGSIGDPALPESREAYDVIVRFFDSHLAQ